MPPRPFTAGGNVNYIGDQLFEAFVPSGTALTMRAFLPFASLLGAAQALHFFIGGKTPKCFFEELPKDTLVVGKYSAEEWNDQTNSWQQHEGINVFISVDVRRAPNPFEAPDRAIN